MSDKKQGHSAAWWRQRRLILAYALLGTTISLIVSLGTFYTVSFGDQTLRVVDGYSTVVGPILAMGLIIAFGFYGNNCLGYSINDGPPLLCSFIGLLASFWLLYYCIYDASFIDGIAQTAEFRALIERNIPRDQIEALVKASNSNEEVTKLVSESVNKAIKDLKVVLHWRYWTLVVANLNSVIAGTYLYLLHSDVNQTQ